MKTNFFTWLVFLSSVCSISLKAQYVDIPDANFRAFLVQNYPQCMNDNKLDTNCFEVNQAYEVKVNNKSISDLTGIQYFKKLNYLYCQDNLLTSLPPLPPNLKKIFCSNNKLTSLPAIPTSLWELYCSNNLLTSLPALPDYLSYISCHSNQLTSLPELPEGLEKLYCKANQLTSLPSLPPYLQYLDCDNNSLTSLPNLPNTLKSLSCDNNKLTSLPELSNTLTEISCNYNELTSLPTLPVSLIELYCSNNKLMSISDLPISLKELHCYHNEIKVLPALPESLTKLMCYNNQLTYLPALPQSLHTLYCGNNLLTSLPALPGSLNEINFRYNKVNCLPFLPENLQYLFSDGNNITCLPNKPSGLITSDNTYAVCNSSNNSNDCQIYSIISGRVYIDTNKDGVLNEGEEGFAGVNINIQPGNIITTTDGNGYFSVTVDIGTYTMDIHDFNLHHYNVPSTIHTAELLKNGLTEDDNNFPIQPKNVINDLMVTITPAGRVRPGRETLYYIHYKNIGTTTLTGDLQLTYDNKVSFNITTPEYEEINGNTIFWDFENLKPGQTGRITVGFTPPSSTAPGTELQFTAIINSLSGDIDQKNNKDTLIHVVTASYDPNMKEVLPLGDLTQDEVIDHDPFTYVVHFQNTGNDTAFVVVIKDTISTNFEIETIQILSSSHPCSFKMKEGAAEFRFNDIMLPDSTIDEIKSHGFVKYRVKPKNSLQVGDEIKNTAHIFFDYNAPITTNTTNNRITLPEGREEEIWSESIQLFPNPTKGVFAIESMNIPSGNASVTILDPTGKVVQHLEDINLNGQKVIQLENAEKGIYYIQIILDKKVLVKKLMIN